MREADLTACRALLRNGSKSFHAASRLLPPSVRLPATALYAFCRLADDAIDGAGASRAALDALGERLDHVYAGQPRNHPCDRALAAVVEAHALPRALPEALLEGVERAPREPVENSWTTASYGFPHLPPRVGSSGYPQGLRS